MASGAAGCAGGPRSTAPPSGIALASVQHPAFQIELRDAASPDKLAQLLMRHGDSPAAIKLELTESFLMENAIATVENLEKLKATGVSLPIDDFGTVYSSLNYIHQFLIDKLKIEQSFGRDLRDDPADLTVSQAIVTMGHTLGQQVVVGGGEHAEEADLLGEAGCNERQGYLFGKPMSAQELRVWPQGHGICEPHLLAPRPKPRKGIASNHRQPS